MNTQLLVTAARLLRPGQVCAAVPGLPAEAARLAGVLHGLTVVPDAGAVGTGVRTGQWIQGGRIDVALLTADQIDARGNLNTTVLGEYPEPVARLAGSGTLAELAAGARAFVVLLPHRLPAFVEHVDFVTAAAGPVGPLAVVTDLGVLRPEPDTGELVLTEVHPGVPVEQVRAETGWPLEVSADLTVTEPPTPTERDALGAA